MKKTFIIESLILFLLILTMTPIIIIVSIKSDHPMYYNYLTILCYLTLAMPIIILLIELYNVAKIKDYKRLNYLNLCMTLILVIGLGIYMLMVNNDISMFYKLKIIYFIFLAITFDYNCSTPQCSINIRSIFLKFLYCLLMRMSI